MADGKNDTALGLGERLRSARKARAMTLEQAAFTLRLEASVLRALEDERYDVLGASVFVRGHLKAYARLLGLSEEAIMAAYRAADPNADVPPKVTRELEKPLTTTPGPVAIAAAVVFAILAMLLLYVLGSGKEPARKALPASEPPATVETIPTLDLAPDAPPVPVATAPAEAAPAVPTGAAPPAAGPAGPGTSPAAPGANPAGPGASSPVDPPKPATSPAPAAPGSPPAASFE